MQDKDLDKLFQSALDDYEMAPSAKVWTGITEQLDSGKRKKAWLPFMSVAAGITLLVTAGMLFIPKEVKVNHPKNDGLADIKQPVKPKLVIATSVATQPVTQPNKMANNAVIAPANNIAVNKIKVHQPAAYKQAVGGQPVNDVVKPDNQPVLASARPDEGAIKPVLPDAAPITEKHINESPALASATAELPLQPTVIKPTTPVKKHKIRSMGDVFNVMIAAVDKRKDKIIEFSNTDEDDATITGINLGIIKVKKEK